MTPALSTSATLSSPLSRASEFARRIGRSGSPGKRRRGPRGGHMRSVISRRHMLEIAVAIGGLAMSVGRVSSQSSKRIEQLAPELEKIISPSEPIHDLADGFGGPLGPAEGALVATARPCRVY